MLIAKIILIVSLIYRLIIHIKRDETYEDIDDRISARLATSTIFLATALLYYFSGIFNITSSC